MAQTRTLTSADGWTLLAVGPGPVIAKVDAGRGEIIIAQQAPAAAYRQAGSGHVAGSAESGMLPAGSGLYARASGSMTVTVTADTLLPAQSRFQTLAQSSVAVAGAADTNENVLASIIVPGNSLGPNGRLRLTTAWSLTNNANNKTLRARLGGLAGVAFSSVVAASALSYVMRTDIANRNNAASQIGGLSLGGGMGLATVALPTATIDTSADALLVLTGQKATAGDSLVLEWFILESLFGPATA